MIIRRQLIEQPDDCQFWSPDYSDGPNLTAFDEELINEYAVLKSWSWVLIFFHCVVFIIGLLGNTLVCVAVYRNHSMRTVTNYFIVNLAVADALVILFCLPFSVVWDVTSTWWFGTTMCKSVLYIQSVSVTVSILTLAFISVDRWYAICHPLKFKSTTAKAKTAIGGIWIIALICEVPEGIFLVAKPYSLKYTYFTQCEPTWGEDKDVIFLAIKMAFFYLLPLFLMSIAYIQIIRVLWRSGRTAHQRINAHAEPRSEGQSINFAMNMNISTEGQLTSRRKAAKMLVVVVVMFAFCFLPVHLFSILKLTAKLTNSDPNRAMANVSHWLCYANSAVNPLIYNFMSGKFRREFKLAFVHCRQNQRTNLNFTRSSTYNNKYTTHNRNSTSRSRTETVPLGSVALNSLH